MEKENENWKWNLKMGIENGNWEWELKMKIEIQEWKLGMKIENGNWKWKVVTCLGRGIKKPLSGGDKGVVGQGG